MALDWENILKYSNPIYPFEQQVQDPDERFLPSEAELLCFEPTVPTFFPIDQYNLQLNPPVSKLDHNPHHHHHHDLILAPKTDPLPYPYLDFPPSLLLPPGDNFPLEQNHYLYCHPQSLHLPKKQTLPLPLPCFTPKFAHLRRPNEGMDVETSNPSYGDVSCSSNGNKGRSISAQSKAARERRRKITEKTQELRKLLPRGTDMNTAQMLEAAFKYVKFLQAQLGILQSIHKFPQESGNGINSKNLHILASQVVQEKLYAKEKCLVPVDFLPMIEEHYHPHNGTFS